MEYGRTAGCKGGCVECCSHALSRTRVHPPQELFRPFGAVSRIFLAVDKNTGENRGFAFVNYVHRCVPSRRAGQRTGHNQLAGTVPSVTSASITNFACAVGLQGLGTETGCSICAALSTFSRVFGSNSCCIAETTPTAPSATSTASATITSFCAWSGPSRVRPSKAAAAAAPAVAAVSAAPAAVATGAAVAAAA